MIIPNPELVVDEARARRQRLIDEADRVRLQRLARTTPPARLLGVRRHIGAWFIALGRRLSADTSMAPSKSIPSI